MSAETGWYHVNGNTYGTWLHGDRRGWRSRHGRDNPVGDYKNPPLAGMYDKLEEYSRKVMKGSPIRLMHSQRRAACEEMARSFLNHQIELLALSVGAEHYHLLARFPDSRVRHWVGLAKKDSSRLLGTLGLTGQVWARKCRPLPIRNRSHHVNTYNYIIAHHKQGSCVWTFKDGLLPLK